MIQSSSNNIQNMVFNKAKKIKSQHQSHHPGLGFHFNLMGCSNSAVVEHRNVYCKLDARDVSGGGGGRISSDVPKGCLAVYVGEEGRRYIIRTHLLNHPIFRALLDKSASEFGFKHTGGLKFLCDTRQFEQLLWIVKNGDRGWKNSSAKSHPPL